jgi:putative ABC transport system substrate-binding protein
MAQDRPERRFAATLTTGIGRRGFIALLGSTAAAWPLAAHAQQSDQMRRIGVLQLLADDDPEVAARRVAFEHELLALGWTVGRNVRIDYRSAKGDANEIRKYAAELIALGPDVILTGGRITVAPVLRATRTIPVVFVQVVDPVGGGLVESLARPGGNATGFTSYEYSLSAKWLELLKEIAPHVTRVAVIRDPTQGAGIGQFAVIQAAGPSLGVELRPINAPDRTEIERAVAAFARSENGGLIVIPGGTGFSRDLIVPRADTDNVRVGDQSQDGQGTWPHRAALAARPRRRGDRMKRRHFIVGMLVTAVAMHSTHARASEILPPGLYQVTTEIGMPHLEENLRYAITRERRCVRHEELSSAFPVLRQNALAGCKLDHESRQGDTVSYLLSCDGTPGTTGRARWQLGSDTIRGTLDVRLGGKNMIFYQRVTARFLGQCLLED